VIRVNIKDIKYLLPSLALLLLLGAPAVAQTKPTAKEFLQRGDTQLSKNNLAKAIRNYSKAIELDPSFAEAYIRRGMARRVIGTLNTAIQDFDMAHAIDPATTVNNRHIAESYSNRGYIEMNDLQIHAAIADLTKAIESYGDAIHYYRRGQARLIDEDLGGAIGDFNDALSLNPQDAFLSMMIHANRGYALLLQGKTNDAQADFDKCLNSKSGPRLIIELHLRTLETRIKELRRRRFEAQSASAPALTSWELTRRAQCAGR
jgi:tetratricopeptide (TPR) repeat protein